MRHQPHDGLAVSSIAYMELWFGATHAPDAADLLPRLADIGIAILAFDEADARAAGEIRSVLRWAGTPMGPYSILIAGQARARNMTLVTHNIRGFARVTDLRVEDWEA